MDEELHGMMHGLQAEIVDYLECVHQDILSTVVLYTILVLLDILAGIIIQIWDLIKVENVLTSHLTLVSEKFNINVLFTQLEHEDHSVIQILHHDYLTYVNNQIINNT